jgi:Mn-dependent DtxR family transcriptional regulator
MLMNQGNTKSLYSEKEGQYLAFIFYYTKINGISPAHMDFQRFFRVSPPTVQQTILQLEKKGLISRIPNTPRSIVIKLPDHEVPALK